MASGLRRDLGTVESYAALLGILIGAGIFKVTGEAWTLTGPSVILGYLVLAPVILATSVAYSVFLSTPLGLAPGGEYTHISRTFGGYGLAFVGAWLKIISYIGALAYLASAFADYLRQLLPMATHRVASVAVLLFFYVVHVAGVRWFGRLQVWMCVLLGISIVTLVVPGLFFVRLAHYRPFFTHGIGGFAASLPPLFFAYAGFESLAQAAGEVRDSTRRLPRIFLGGIVTAMAVFLLMSVVALGVLPPAQLQVSEAPMADAAARYLPVGAAALVTLGALMAFSTSVNATMLVPSRIAIMLAEDGVAPRWLGRVSRKTGTPVPGLTITLIAALTLLLTGQVGLALNIAVFALVVLYFLHSLALLVLPRANGELFRSVTVGIPLSVQRLSAIVSIAAMALFIALQVAHDVRVLRTSLTTIELAAFWAAAGAALYGLRRVADRRAARGVEHSQ